MDSETTKPSEATYFDRSYPGAREEAHQVRADLAPVVGDFPAADDLVLIASELATNAILHSQSGQPGSTFTVRAELHPGQYAWLEVEDLGGDWAERDLDDDEHGRGLAILAYLAGDGNWGIESGDVPGTRVVWVRLDWGGPAADTPVLLPSATLGNAQGMNDGLIAARCSCGFRELADEEVIDHLELVFVPDDLTGNDGQAHEEYERLTCACGLSAITSEELDEHFLKVFTPYDAVGRDGRRHEQPGAGDGA
jgi:anti-sigma regulatory factor (Ser/Thr protein kinase)